MLYIYIIVMHIYMIWIWMCIYISCDIFRTILDIHTRYIYCIIHVSNVVYIYICNYIQIYVYSNYQTDCIPYVNYCIDIVRVYIHVLYIYIHILHHVLFESVCLGILPPWHPFPQTEGVFVARESKFSSLRPQTLHLKRHCSWTSWNCASVGWIHGTWQQQTLGNFEMVKRIGFRLFWKLFISNYPSSWCSCLALKVINCCYVDAWSQIATTAADTCQKQLKFWKATFDAVTVCISFNHFVCLPWANFTTAVVGGYDHLLLGFPPAAPEPFGGKGGEDQQPVIPVVFQPFSYPQTGGSCRCIVYSTSPCWDYWQNCQGSIDAGRAVVFAVGQPVAKSLQWCHWWNAE